MTVERWQISGTGPENYERFAVGGYLGALAAAFLEMTPIHPGDRVLDVACGTGIVARLSVPRVGTKGTVTGLDLNADMLAHAQTLSANLEIAWRQGDAAALPFADETFDVVLCQQGLQFVPEKLLALTEMRRVLASQGRLGLNVSGPPSEFQLALADALSIHVDAAVARTSLAPFAVREPEPLLKLIEEAGFTDVQLHTLVRTRKIVPTQEWLLEYSAGLPYAAAIRGTLPAARAALMRDVSARLKAYWVGAHFEVPWIVFVAMARR